MTPLDSSVIRKESGRQMGEKEILREKENDYFFGLVF
jgi:hypothetical protein